MQFLIKDRVTKEIIGLFKTTKEAELYYLKNNVVERLKIYLSKLINRSECMENIDTIRKMDSLICDIIDYNIEDVDINFTQKFSYFMQLANNYLCRCKLSQDEVDLVNINNYSIERFDDDTLKRISY